MTNEADPHKVRSSSIEPVTLEVAAIVRRGMVAWSERIARTALDRLPDPGRRPRATDTVQTAPNLRGSSPKTEIDQ